uniref:Mu NS viral factory protein n=1 Tax=Cataraqui virus TaxID=2776967 RepID=A0A8E4QJJ9_9REOV|nr:MAG: mu NS viral factory protein [Cataraqui virus]QPB10701.1 MAG: mu NS viral factory protein [Cataraqui virus]
MSTGWGDEPMSLSAMNHNSAQVRSATQQFLSVPLSSTTPIANSRRNIVIRYAADGSLVTKTGPLIPMDEWLFEHQATINEAAVFLSDPDSLKHVKPVEKYMIRKEHQIGEIINRIRLYMLDVLQLTLSPTTIQQLGEHLITREQPIESTHHGDPQVVPSVTAIAEGKQTLSDAPGRYDEEEYNAGRGKFLTHQVFDLSTSTPGIGDKIKEYWEVVPSVSNGTWNVSAKTGLLIRAPQEDLSSQTTFTISWQQSLMILNAGDVVVASYDVHDVDKLAPEHHQSVKRDSTVGSSAYSRLLERHGVVFFTAAALRWMIQNKYSDSMVSPRHIRVCVGFDPLVARWTQDGFHEAAVLMDDRLESIGRQRMMMRVLRFVSDSPATNFLSYFLVGRFNDFKDQYSVSSCDRYGVSKMSRSEPAPDPDVTCLHEEIAALKAKLVTVTEAQQNMITTSSPSNAKLLARINELTRINKELALKQSDIERRPSSQLDSYLHKHVCVNAKDFDISLMKECGIEQDMVDIVMDRRMKNRKRFEERLEADVMAKIQPRLDELEARLLDKDREIDDLTNHAMSKQDEVDALEAKIKALEDDLREIRNRAHSINVENHRLSRLTKVGHQFCSDAPPDGYQMADRSPKWEQMVDEL